MIELPLLVVLLGCGALVYMGLLHSKLSHKASFMVNCAADEQMLNMQLRGSIDATAEALDVIATSLRQDNFDSILDREGIDGYQLLEKVGDDLQELAFSSRKVTGSEYHEIDYDTEDEEGF